ARAPQRRVPATSLPQHRQQPPAAPARPSPPPPSAPPQLLFWLPVTKPWLRQLVLGLTLICHSSLRGVTELLSDLFDYPLSLGTVHNILHQAVQRARERNVQQGLAPIRIGAHDEIFQAGQPVLVGADVAS